MATSSGMAALSPAQIQDFNEQGFVIVREAFSIARVEALKVAISGLCDRAAALPDTAESPIPWIDKDRALPARLSHLLQPERYDPAYGEWLAEDLVPAIDSLLPSGAGGRHSLFGMLAGGAGQPYQQNWHRDIQFLLEDTVSDADLSEEECLELMQGKSVQFNAPLFSDSHLHIVPRSHLRGSTPTEIAEAARGTDAAMPGATVVQLEPGDIVYYNACLWHRGWNPSGELRWTLHCAFWDARFPVMTHEHGQREALLANPGHIERMPPAARVYMRRYVDNHPVAPDPVATVLQSPQLLYSPQHMSLRPTGLPAHPVLLSQAQVDFFTAFGFLSLPGALAQDIAWVQHEFEAVWAARDDLVHDGSKRSMFPGLFVAQSPRLSTLVRKNDPFASGACLSRACLGK
jgi:hypothetical protein